MVELLGLAVAVLVFVNAKGFAQTKGFVAAALLLETGYFLSLLCDQVSLFTFFSRKLALAYIT